MGASRWLDANRLQGTSMSSAMPRAGSSFILFMENLSRSEFDVRRHRESHCLGRGATPGRLRLATWLRLLAYVRAQSQIGWVRVSDSEPSRPYRISVNTRVSRFPGWVRFPWQLVEGDRKSTRLNSSHGYISYAVFCLKKKYYAH